MRMLQKIRYKSTYPFIFFFLRFFFLFSFEIKVCLCESVMLIVLDSIIFSFRFSFQFLTCLLGSFCFSWVCVIDRWVLFVLRYAKVLVFLEDSLQYWPLIVSRTGGLRSVSFLWESKRAREREDGRKGGRENKKRKEILQYLSLLYTSL